MTRLYTRINYCDYDSLFDHFQFGLMEWIILNINRTNFMPTETQFQVPNL